MHHMSKEKDIRNPAFRAAVLERMSKLLVRSIDPSSAEAERNHASAALKKIAKRYNIAIEEVAAEVHTPDDPNEGITQEPMIFKSEGKSMGWHGAFSAAVAQGFTHYAHRYPTGY